MSSVLQHAAAVRPRLLLLGTGVVGSAFIARYQRLRAAGMVLPEFGWLCNSRVALAIGNDDPLQLLRHARSANGASTACTPAEPAAGDIVIDATASEAMAAQHLAWLQRGVHVVTANKLGNGGGLQRAQAIAKTVADGAVHYGDAATVGAGLPLLRSVRALVAGGDRITRIEGVLSGSLAWLFSQYDGMRPFSGFVRQAREAGYTEPDPRIDLSGEDVRRKLLILARATGKPLAAEDVQVNSLVPASLAALPLCKLDGALGELDAPLSASFAQAYRNAARLRFIGSFSADGASVGVQALPLEHALCGGGGTDNKVAIFSDRYDVQPLVIQGPGAGAEVTAAGLLDDVLTIVAKNEGRLTF